MIAVITSCGSNFASISNALKRLHCEFILTDKSEEILNADKVILPGVGCAQVAMNKIYAAGLVQTIRKLQQPVLGICLGMQLLYQRSEEQDIDCLGIFSQNIKRLPVADQFPVPHMGWNRIKAITPNNLISLTNDHYYFVHSFYAPISTQTIATTEYGCTISAVVRKDNFYGMQFHPEKSGVNGLTLLKNFLRL